MKTMDTVPAIAGVIIAVFVSRWLNLGFWTTLFCSVIGGLLVILATLIIKQFTKKKLCAIINIEKNSGDVCKVEVLIWNPAWLRTIFSSDFGASGICFSTNYDTVIKELKLRNSSQNFSFSRQRGTSENEVIVRISDLSFKSFAIFEFSISANIQTPILRPFDVKFHLNSKEKIVANLICDRSNIRVAMLKYSKTRQIFHWIFAIAAIVSPILTMIAVFVIERFSLPFNTLKVSALGVTALISCVMFFAALGDAVPPFVSKYCKEKNSSKIKKKANERQ